VPIRIEGRKDKWCGKGSMVQKVWHKVWCRDRGIHERMKKEVRKNERVNNVKENM